MNETIVAKDKIVNALNDKQNKNHKEIISNIIKFMPKNKVSDCFMFICQGAAKTPLSRDIGKQILDALLREDDVETVNDDGDIQDLRTVGDIAVAMNIPYVAKKYPSIISDVSSNLFDDLTKQFYQSPQYCGLIAKMLDNYADNTII